MFIQISFILVLHSKFAYARFIDLGHDLSDDTPVFPLPLYSENPFTLKVLVSHDMIDKKDYWFALNSFCSIEHVGTHVDAPYYAYEDKWSVEQIPVENLIAHAVMIDVKEKARSTRNYEVSAEDVNNWILENGPIPNNSLIIANTGWYKRYPNITNYFGHENDSSKFNWPGFGADAIAVINNYKKTQGIHVVGYGIDTISLSAGSFDDFPTQQAVLEENQYIIENMNNLDELPAKGAIVMVMPMKIKGGTGGPARVVAQLLDGTDDEQQPPKIKMPT